MKRGGLIFCLIAVITGAQAEDTYRDFTDTQGRTIRGRVLAYDTARGEVSFERENGRTAKVPVTIFSEADRQYIEKWNNQAGVRSTTRFRISCDRRAVRDWSEKMMGTIHYSDGSVQHDQVTGKKDFAETNYEIVLVNRNSHPITDLVLEYCIYYQQELMDGAEAQQGVLFGSVPIEKLDASERRTIETDSVVVFKEETNAEFLYSRVLNGEVNGICLRLYLKDGDERVLVREVGVPDSIPDSYEWVAQSRPVNIRKGE
jgi:hypothetical protein